MDECKPLARGAFALASCELGTDPHQRRAVNNHGIEGVTIAGLEIRRVGRSGGGGQTSSPASVRSDAPIEQRATRPVADQLMYALSWGASPAFPSPPTSPASAATPASPASATPGATAPGRVRGGSMACVARGAAGSLSNLVAAKTFATGSTVSHLHTAAGGH